MKLERILIPILAVFLLSNLSLSIFLVSRSFKAQKQRSQSQQLLENQQDQLQRQQAIVKRFECILLINPNTRTPETVNKACGIRQ